MKLRTKLLSLSLASSSFTHSGDGGQSSQLNLIISLKGLKSNPLFVSLMEVAVCPGGWKDGRKEDRTNATRSTETTNEAVAPRSRKNEDYPAAVV
jgi:hypothetical protein